jgi:glucokinase
MKPPSKASITGAVDIGGTKIAVGAVDEQGRVLAKEETPTAAGEGFDQAMERVIAMLLRVRKAAGVEYCGIGIGCTGPVDPITGVIGDVDFLPGWSGCNPVRVLSDAFHLDVAMENDADAATLGEAAWGAGRGKSSMICITIGTGIGGGIWLNGTLYRGVNGSHPEIGHHVIEPDGPKCFCGAHGCWEVLARGPAIAERMQAHLPEGSPRRKGLTAKTVCDLARSGDPLAISEVGREGNYLGLGVANLVTLFAPETVVLGGNVMGSADLFLPLIKSVVRQNCGLVPVRDVEIVLPKLGNDAPLIGAGMVWRHRYEKTGDKK